MSRALRFVAAASLLAAGRRRSSGGWRRRPTRPSARKLEGKPVPAFALAAGACRQARRWRRPISRPASRGWSISSPAGACPASPKRRCFSELKAPRRRRSTASPSATGPRTSPHFLARNGDPYRAHRQRPAEPRADRARLVGRAGKLRRRWQGRHPLPAYRPDRAGGRADDPREAGAGEMKRLARSSCAARWRSRCSPTATCRRLTGPTASCPTRARKRRPQALMEELRCLVCQGQSIADSDAELAGDMRDSSGAGSPPARSPAAIRAWLVAALRQLDQLQADRPSRRPGRCGSRRSRCCSSAHC